MRKHLAAALVALAALAGLALAPSARAQHYSPSALQVLAQARAASGAGRWNGLRGWHEVGSQGGVRYERWVDPVRYGDREQTGATAGLRVRGFNGAAEWTIAPDGQVTGRADRATVSRARTEAFFAASGYFFPSRFAAEGELLGARRLGGRAFDVVRVRPMGGAARELWFDRRTRLLARTVDRSGPRPVTVTLSDYRRAGGVTAPFRIVLEDGAGAAPVERRIERIAFEAPDRAMFSLPRTPGHRR